MPKMKTNRAAAKRFKVLSSGKIKRKKMNRAHLLSAKSVKRKRHLRSQGYVHESDLEGVRRMLPYWNK
jgi:large subunit ribosomal protein L35